MLNYLKNFLRKRELLYKAYNHLKAAFCKPVFNNLQQFFVFIGYPRSGHTLVGSLLDAHPEIVCSIEANVLKLCRQGYSRKALFYYVLKRSRVFAKKLNFTWTGYSYYVEDMCQGRFSTLRCMGDKKGAGSTIELSKNINIIDELAIKCSLPVKILHVVRNPFDNISTITLRAMQKGSVFSSRLLSEKIDYYFWLAQTNQRVIEKYSNKVLTLYHEDMVKTPEKKLAEIFSFLDVHIDQASLIKLCAKINSEVNKTRHKIEWDKANKEKALAEMQKIDFLSHYSWNS
ncbi:MAG: sulfotransferase [Bacteroidales bacterium]|nr:sulfotransferase [Bacteroidales bacterium]